VKIKVKRKRLLLLFLLGFCFVTSFIVLVTCLAVLVPRNKDKSEDSSIKSHSTPTSPSSSITPPPSAGDGIAAPSTVPADPANTSEDDGENFLGNPTESSPEAETPQSNEPVVEESDVQTYVCPDSYSYISYEDARNFQDRICANKTGGVSFRVEEGGSVTCGDDGLSIQKSDPRLLDQTVCVKTTYSNPKKVSNKALECPTGLARASLEEAKVYIKQLCPKLGKWDILRVGVQGAFYGPGYGCKLYDWYAGSVTDVLCIKREIIDMTFGPSNENVCGNESSLFTVQEALENSEKLCSKISVDGSARLAGGSAMYGSDNDCMIIDVDRKDVSQALCGSLPRN